MKSHCCPRSGQSRRKSQRRLVVMSPEGCIVSESGICWKLLSTRLHYTPEQVKFSLLWCQKLWWVQLSQVRKWKPVWLAIWRVWSSWSWYLFALSVVRDVPLCFLKVEWSFCECSQGIYLSVCATWNCSQQFCHPFFISWRESDGWKWLLGLQAGTLCFFFSEIMSCCLSCRFRCKINLTF